MATRLDVTRTEAPAAPAAWLGPTLVAAAFVLRLADALRASFHLDDFHSLHHARAATLPAFFDVLAQDNHPPLSFLVLRTVRQVFGESELALRMPNVLYGTLTVALAWRLGRRLPSTSARVLGTGFVALSSLHLDLSSDLRMYALLGLCVLGLLDALLDGLAPTGDGRPRRAALRVALWTATALASHYHALHAGAVIGASLLALVAARRLPLRALALPLAAAGAGVLAVLPWYLTGFREQLSHELAPGGATVSLRILAESLVHLVYVRLELAGVLKPAVLALGLCTPALALLGAGLVLRRSRPEPGGSAPVVLVGLLVALAFALPAWTAAAAWLQPRAGFEWRYLAAAIAPFCLLVGAAAGPGPLRGARVALVGACLAAASLLAVGHVADPGREDYRGASAHLLAHAQPGDGVLGVEWQPRLFPRGGGLWTYLRLLAPEREEELVRLDHTPDFALADPERVAALPRVHVLTRSIPDDVRLLRTLRARFPREVKRRFGEAVWVLTFSRD